MRVAVTLLVVLTACGSNHSAASSDAAGSGSSSGCPGFETGAIGGSRPVHVHVPASYNCQPVPLVIMLHGYSATSLLEESYLYITPQSDARGFIYATPDGTVDSTGNEFWNATDACCNLDGSTVDDSTYLSGVITEIESHYAIDPKQVFLVGHSNGGFMSYRMACDHADQIAAFASLAGAMWEDTTKCKPANPVAMLEIHGTADTTIAYNGGTIGASTFPSAPTSVSDWVTFDGCDTTADTSAAPLDLDTMLAGDETTITRYATGCQSGGHAELWSIQGGGHIPSLTTSFTPDVLDFLFAHPKP